MKCQMLAIFVFSLICFAKLDNSSFLKSASTIIDPSQDSLPEPRIYLGYCFVKIKNQFFDLNRLDSLKPHHIKSKNGQIVQFNFCSNIETACAGNEALIVSKERCKRFSESNSVEKTWNLFEDKSKRSVLSVVLHEGDVCKKTANSVERYQTQYEITCDMKVNDVVITNEKEFDSKKCLNVIKIKSKYGCPVGRFRAWWHQFGVPKQSIAVMLIIIGLYFIIFGETCWHVNSIIINSAILGLIFYSVLSLFFKVNMGMCMMVGILIAFAVFTYKSLNGITLGIVVGYLTGNLLYNIIIKLIPANPQILYWSLISTCILGVSIAGGLMEEYMVCLATSLVGAYSLVRGVSVFSGGYPDETYVMNLINMKEYDQFGRVFGPLIYMYIGGILLMTCLGCMIQFHFKESYPSSIANCSRKEEPKTETQKEASTPAETPKEETPLVKETPQEEKIGV